MLIRPRRLDPEGQASPVRPLIIQFRQEPEFVQPQRRRFWGAAPEWSAHEFRAPDYLTVLPREHAPGSTGARNYGLPVD